jgi:uncharacterized protein
MWQLSINEAKEYYDTHDSAHGFSHVLRVYQLAMQIGEKEGANLDILRPAALLHDVENSMLEKEKRKQHHLLSAIFAGKLLAAHGWIEEDIKSVQHCIRAHRYRDENENPQTVEAKCLFDADKLDSIGAFGAARAIAVSVEKGLPFYTPPSQQFLQTGKLADGEPHTAYHEYWFKLRHVRERLLTGVGKALAQDRHRTMSAFFEALASEYDAASSLQE